MLVVLAGRQPHATCAHVEPGLSLRKLHRSPTHPPSQQFQHFGLAAAAGAYRCKCGAPNCRGTMDTQPERTRVRGSQLVGSAVAALVQGGRSMFVQHRRWLAGVQTRSEVEHSAAGSGCPAHAELGLITCVEAMVSSRHTRVLPGLQDFGRRIDVWWPAERRYFRGTITGYNSGQQRHTVKYDDGDVGRLYLPAEKYRCMGWLRWVDGVWAG